MAEQRSDLNGFTKFVMACFFSVLIGLASYFNNVQVAANDRQDLEIKEMRGEVTSVKISIAEILQTMKSIDKDTSEIKSGIDKIWRYRYDGKSR